jgi:site-specific DNA-cytosine methylase
MSAITIMLRSVGIRYDLSEAEGQELLSVAGIEDRFSYCGPPCQPFSIAESAKALKTSGLPFGSHVRTARVK